LKSWLVRSISTNRALALSGLEKKMKTIEQQIRNDIPSPIVDIDVLDIVVHRRAVIYDEARLPGYFFIRGDYFVTDGSGTCVYRPVNADYERVWSGGEWAQERRR
jgi:hypothetical protein